MRQLNPKLKNELVKCMDNGYSIYDIWNKKKGQRIGKLGYISHYFYRKANYFIKNLQMVKASHLIRCKSLVLTMNPIGEEALPVRAMRAVGFHN